MLEILKSAKDERELENKMMLLLGHDKFSFIRLLRKNKNMVLYCTLLATAQSAKDKKEIEEKMSSDPDLASILHALTETEQEDLIQVRYKNMLMYKMSRYQRCIQSASLRPGTQSY